VECFEVVAAWLPRAAPNANAAVSAAAPAAAQPVMVATLARAPALSIAMAVRLDKARKPTRSHL
jgi:hypothetical protein